MVRHWMIAVVIGVLGLNISPTQTVSAPLQLTITPDHVHTFPGNDVNIMCKANEPLTHCQFKVRHIPVYDLSAGLSTPYHKEFEYYGEGLNNGDCGVKIIGKQLEFVVYVVGCRARTNTSDWAFRETALISKRRDGIEVSFKPGRTLVLLPGEPIKVIVDAHKPLSRCGFVLANDFSKTNNNRRFNFDQDNVPFKANAKGTDIEYFGEGVEKGQCGFQMPSAREEFNDGAWIDVFDKEEHEETLFFRIIVARPPIAPTLTHRYTVSSDGVPVLNAWCSATSRPSANITWYFDDKTVEDKFSQFLAVEEWLWPSNMQTVTQKLTLPLGREFDGKYLWCTADHFAMKTPVESERIKIEFSSPPDTPILDIKSPYFAEDSVLEATCIVNNWQPDARITWYLGGGILRQDSHNDDPDVSPDAKTMTQRLKHPLQRRENGFDLRCEVAHSTLPQPLQSSRVVKFTYCSPLISKTVRISCSVAGEQVDCAQPQQVGTVAQLSCKPGYVAASGVVYRRVTCLRAVRWDREVFVCTPACGKRNTNSGTTLIFGGEDSRIGEFPWHVGIYEKSSTDLPQQSCGGTLISPNMVVSAAHCFWSNQERGPKDASKILIAAGKHVREWDDLDLNVQRRNLSQIILPLRYSGRLSQFASDIALLRLSVEVEMTATVNLICIDWDNVLERAQLREGSVGTVAGWGYTENGDQSQMLKYVNLPYISAEVCATALNDETEPVFTHDKFCAGYVNKSTSVCRGDSGGGLVFLDPGTDKYYLRGIVSIAFTPPSHNAVCYSQLYTGFTRFSMFLNWIQENI